MVSEATELTTSQAEAVCTISTIRLLSSNYYFRFLFHHIGFHIDAVGFRCRSLFRCLGDPLGLSKVVHNSNGTAETATATNKMTEWMPVNAVGLLDVVYRASPATSKPGITQTNHTKTEMSLHIRELSAIIFALFEI
jgi:hypothetical protein